MITVDLRAMTALKAEADAALKEVLPYGLSRALNEAMAFARTGCEVPADRAPRRPWDNKWHGGEGYSARAGEYPDNRKVAAVWHRKEWLTIHEAALLLEMPESKFRRRCQFNWPRHARIPSIRVGCRIFVRRGAIRKWQQAQALEQKARRYRVWAAFGDMDL